MVDCGMKKCSRKIQQRSMICWPSATKELIRPIRWSPLDCFGFRVVCCWCVPLRVAAGFICSLTFLWATFDMYTADTFLRKAIEDKNVVYYLKFFVCFVAIGLMVAAGVLLLGILLEKYVLVNFYIWYALVYEFYSIILYLVIVIMIMTKGSKVNLRVAIKLGFAVVWYTLMFYFLIIVNSYKSNLW